MNRRSFLAAAGSAAAAATMTNASSDAAGFLTELRPTGGKFDLAAASTRMELLGPGKPDSELWLYANRLFPVIRARQGEELKLRFRNGLPHEHSTIHWHGIRLPNAMDGVPNITQPPVKTGESFFYAFAPPDAGTFFFHPHCNEPQQSGQGLAGILIVEGDGQFDDDIILATKDWRLEEDGSFAPFTTTRGASRAGSFGRYRTVNGVPTVRRSVRAGADVRVRILNLDATRILEVGQEGGEAAVIAIDGNAVAPFPLDTWRMGPAMRLDLVLRTPAEGGEVRIRDYAGAEIAELAKFVSAGGLARQANFAPRALKPSPIPEPSLETAERQTFVFGAASDSIAEIFDALPAGDPLAAELLDSMCTGSDTFWSINKRAWPKDGHERVPPPLAALKHGRSYRFTLQNATPHSHPVHLHGHTFKVLSSNKRLLPPHYADTVLLAPKERIDIAFVAREGNWMFHCHILEHQETGMMGYFRIA